MASATDNKPHFVHGGRFLKVDQVKAVPEQRSGSDRRRTLRGDPSLSDSGKERRRGARRLEDVIVKIELADPHALFVNAETLHKTLRKQMTREFEIIAKRMGVESCLSLIESGSKVIVETKMKFRDKVKQYAAEKGLSFEVIDDGIYIGTVQHVTGASPETPVSDKINHEATELYTVLGFYPESIEEEEEKILFKVFVKCMNQVHPVSSEAEKDALKQDVDTEHRIIFIAEKHYPKSEKNNYRMIIGQVFAENIKAYNQMIQLKAEITMLEDRYQLSNDNRLKLVIQGKQQELDEMENSSLEETIRMLYLYLDYFKDILKVGPIRERIENIFEKVNEKQFEVLDLRDILEQTQQLMHIEEEIRRKQPENALEYLGYLKWLKNEINREVDFTRHLWINNMKGKAYIDQAINRTLSAIKQ